MSARANPAEQVAFAHRVSDIQRARLLVAMTEVVADSGVANVSVADVVDRAGISRRTFYELFDSRDDCFVAAFERAVGVAREQALLAAEPEGRWSDAVRAAVYALLELFDEQPTLARFLVVETLCAGPSAIERRRLALATLAHAVEGGRREAKPEAAITPLTAEAAVGGALSLVHTRICEGSKRPLVELAGPVIATIVLPYLGAAAARREIARPAPKRRRRLSPPAPADSLRDLPIRLTHRSVLALQAIAFRPGASNRDVGRAAGIEDQGQASKLLKRLSRVGLILNTRDPSLRGAPNAWVLTDDGEALLRIVGRADNTERARHARGDGR